MKKVKEFTPEEVQDFVLLCVRTQWASLGYANSMERDLNAAIARQKSERAEEEKADLPFPAPKHPHEELNAHRMGMAQS